MEIPRAPYGILRAPYGMPRAAYAFPRNPYGSLFWDPECLLGIARHPYGSLVVLFVESLGSPILFMGVPWDPFLESHGSLFGMIPFWASLGISRISFLLFLKSRVPL